MIKGDTYRPPKEMVITIPKIFGNYQSTLKDPNNPPLWVKHKEYGEVEGQFVATRNVNDDWPRLLIYWPNNAPMLAGWYEYTDPNLLFFEK